MVLPRRRLGLLMGRGLRELVHGGQGRAVQWTAISVHCGPSALSFPLSLVHDAPGARLLLPSSSLSAAEGPRCSTSPFSPYSSASHGSARPTTAVAKQAPW